MDRIPPHNNPFIPSPLQFQLPQFLLGDSPVSQDQHLLPRMYSHSYTEYDKNWYDHTKYYLPDDLPPDTLSASSNSSRPFEFSDSPSAFQTSASASPSPPARPLQPPVEQPYVESNPPTYHQDSTLPSYPQDQLLPPLPNFSFPPISSLNPTTPLPPIPGNGLPLYSASGFDMLKMLGKVATRPNPKIMLGPVDMTCSFVVVDVRRFDSPIVYASPTFTRLTGYSEAEVLGRNCRFLQSPTGQVSRGEDRRFTAPDAVRHLQKCLLQEKECQASLINYRKDGGAFINLVTVIPIAADDCSDEITHHVGFQVDLAEQPNAILQKLRDGSYIVNYSNSASPSGLCAFGRDVRRSRGVSQEMLDIVRSNQPWALGNEASVKPVRDHERSALHAMILENTDDFIHVVSLKGALLYVASAVQRVLGYDPTELIGKSIADLCHPADVVPLMRELKEASSTPSVPTPPPREGPPPLFALPQHQHTPPPKPVNLLFRVRHKTGEYMWLESRGRLHVEQGKGRKAIVLVGRCTSVPRLRWGNLAPDGATDCWGLVAPNGLVLSASGVNIAHLGYGSEGVQLVGRSLANLVTPEDSRRVVDVLAAAACADKDEVRRIECGMLVRGAEPRVLRSEIIFYTHEREAGDGALPPRLVFQLRLSNSSEEMSRRRIRSPETEVLEDLDTAHETSWQYELIRLRFENKRMRDEVAALERAQGHMSLLLHRASSPVMSSLGAPPPQTALSIPSKRRHGEIKLPELPHSLL